MTKRARKANLLIVVLLFHLLNLSMLVCYSFKFDLKPMRSFFESNSGNEFIRNRVWTPVRVEKKFCDYEFDMFDCLNVNCNGMKSIKQIPRSLKELTNITILNKNQLLCSIDFSDTGIHELTDDLFENLNYFLNRLIMINKNHEKSTIKLSFSNITNIDVFKLPANINIAAFISDSQVNYIQSKSLFMNKKFEINLINFTTDSFNWLKLLESSKLRLLNLRNITNLNQIQTKPFQISSINDVKIFDSYLPVLDNSFFIFNILNYIEQLELVGCSIEYIEDGLFELISNLFLNLKVLTLTNNKLNRITNRTFKGLLNLKLLDLDENPIEFIHENAFDDLINLETISLSNNVKYITLMNTYPIWLEKLMMSGTDLIKNSPIQEINFKNNFWLLKICNINTFINLINKANKKISDLLEKVDLIDTSNLSTSMKLNHGRKYLRLFQNRLNKTQLYNEFKNEEFICNSYFICKYLDDTKKKLYGNNANFNNYKDKTEWRMESFSLCSKLTYKNLEQKCLFSEKIAKCGLEGQGEVDTSQLTKTTQSLAHTTTEVLVWNKTLNDSLIKSNNTRSGNTNLLKYTKFNSRMSSPLSFSSLDSLKNIKYIVLCIGFTVLFFILSIFIYFLHSFKRGFNENHLTSHHRSKSVTICNSNNDLLTKKLIIKNKNFIRYNQSDESSLKESKEYIFDF